MNRKEFEEALMSTIVEYISDHSTFRDHYRGSRSHGSVSAGKKSIQKESDHFDLYCGCYDGAAA